MDHIIAIPGEVLNDKTINLWEQVKPQLAAGIEAALTEGKAGEDGSREATSDD